MSTNNSNASNKYLIVALLVVIAFFGSYNYALSKSRGSANLSTAYNNLAGGTQVGSGGGATGGAGGGGGGCCGGGGSQTPVPGSTTVSGGTQKVTIDLTGGSYSPNQITAKAGVPLELDFKGPASGCNGYVQSQQLGFQQDVSNGGTIKVGALQPGTYQFTCSMGMYTANIVVK